MRTEVTVEQFRRFVRQAGYRTEAEQKGDDWTWFRPRAYRLQNQQPVMYVTANDAEAYCAYIGGRLPTEAEWSYAFQAGEGRQGRLWWNTDGRYVWFRENSDFSPRPVGTKLPNAWGLYDMEGNAWEWTRTTESSGPPYWIRGGSWITCPVIEGRPGAVPAGGPFTRCGSDGKVHLRDDIGFRCAK
jgi:formylglycine-generating enzyme required for sulfatase activity